MIPSSNMTVQHDHVDDNNSNFATLYMIQGSIYVLIFCAGLVNNLLTMLIILLNRDMRTVTNCYLLNLAISDSLPLIVSLPFEISFFPIRVPRGDLGCQFRAVLAETSTNASILTISAFTIERYLAVCRPLRTSSFSTTTRANRVQLLIWFIAILSSTPYFYLTQNIEDQCLLNPLRKKFATICFSLSASLFFLIPALILCFLYALMARHLYAASQIERVRWSKEEKIRTSLAPTDLVMTPLDQDYRFSRHASTNSLVLKRSSFIPQRQFSTSGMTLPIQSMKKSAFKMLVAVVIAFIICYAPFHVQRVITSRISVNDLSIYEKRVLTIFFFVSGIFYYLGSTVNPIFYHLFSRKFRSACRRTMKRLCSCRKSPRPRPSNTNHPRTPDYLLCTERLEKPRNLLESLYERTERPKILINFQAKRVSRVTLTPQII